MSDRDADVAVVGAGLSGLAAARALRAQGASVVVLEARERVGGRTDAGEPEPGVRVDLGGTWIGPGQDRVAALARALGVATIPQYACGDHVLELRGRVRRHGGTIPRLSPLALLDLARLRARMGRAARRVDAEAPWAAERAAALDAVSLGDHLRARRHHRDARTLLTLAGRTIWGAEPDEMSLLYVLSYVAGAGGLDPLLETEGGAQHLRFDGGAHEIARRAAADLGEAVVLGAPVHAVRADAAGVLVEAAGRTVRAARAIVALPPPLCAGLEIDPPPGAARATVARSWRMGALAKCFAVYDEPFWRARGLSGEGLSDRGPASLTFDVSPPDGSRGVLVGFVGGADWRASAHLHPDVRRSLVLAGFSRLYGVAALRPRAYAERAWSLERWSAGGPVAVAPPGALTAGGDALRAPCGRVHWAGTESAGRWAGFLDGAVRSGERAAAEALAAL